MKNPTRNLKVVEATGIEHTVDAPPVLVASSHTIDFLCGNCGTVLMHAEDDQLHGLFIHCTQCGACNSTANLRPLSRGSVRSSGCDAVCLQSIFTGT
jgi:predicted RNA-binding Zn-ribbon protein involved in translation (DUF1610 family)